MRSRRPALIAGAWLLGVVAVSALGPFIHGARYDSIDLTSTFAPPGGQYPLGADESGRDVLARLLEGGRVSLVVGAVAALIAVSFGTAVGAVAGHAGGRIDDLLMRITDTSMSVPTFFLLLMLLALFGSGVGVMVVGIGLTSWEGVARVVRSEILRHKEMDFVMASRSVGLSERRVLVRHLLPQAIPSIIVAAMLATAYAILAEAGLSYLGLGIQPPTPSWGNMLSNAQQYLYSAPVLAIYPGVMIMLTVLSLNIFGDGLRDALDPQLAGEA